LQMSIPYDVHCTVLDLLSYSLSRREESYKHKLSDCLLVCPHFTDWSKTNPRIKGIIVSKT